MVIPNDGFFYSTHTRIVDSFSCTPLFLFINLFIEEKLPEVPEFAKVQFHMMTFHESMGNISFSIPG